MVRASALIVEPLPSLAAPLAAVLSSAGCHVTAVGRYEEARHVLDSSPPTVLVTEIRLGAFNGLQLVLRGKAVRPRLAAIAMSAIDDPVLRSEAEQLGATFIKKPIAELELLAAIFRTLARGAQTLPPIRAPFERRVRDRRGVTDVTHDPERRVADRRADTLELLARFALR
jgi:DNA-binding response OmpR family regulator